MLIHKKILYGVISILILGIPTKSFCMEEMSKYGTVGWEGALPTAKLESVSQEKPTIRLLKVKPETFKINGRGMPSWELDEEIDETLRFKQPIGVYSKKDKSYILSFLNEEDLLKSGSATKTKSVAPKKHRKAKEEKDKKREMKERDKEEGKTKKKKRAKKKEKVDAYDGDL